MTHVDRTLRDLGRRELNLREYLVDGVLSDYIVENFPNFTNFLKKYYSFEQGEYYQDPSPSRLLDELFKTRDITQSDITLLSFIEDELLLGQSYFDGFPDKREAAKYSNTLYRSKGTKYSIQQFFRTFFQIDPDIVYTKEQVFIVGDSRIGAESQRFLTDDKLYQQFAILIKSELPLETWRETYKLFTHPAGMYLGSEVQIVGVFDLDLQNQPDPGLQDIPEFIIDGFASVGITASDHSTALFDMRTGDSDGDIELFRTTLGTPGTYPNKSGNELKDYENFTLQQVDNQYSSIGELLEPNSPTLDDDDDVGGINGFDISSTETIDQERFDWNDSSDNLINLHELL